jgi:three-Cys-motif partner protein
MEEKEKNEFVAPAQFVGMVAEGKQAFGGSWTEKKLGVLREYLCAYTKALKNQSFYKLYIDAFAGTGYRETAQDDMSLFFDDDESNEIKDGSARHALRVAPSFDGYYFIEQNGAKLDELKQYASNITGALDKSDFRIGDANTHLPKVCDEIDWKRARAVLFLDPFGMCVKWSTMEAIAKTQAIDVWILFPAGVGVNRLLTKNPDSIPEQWAARLDIIFGTSEWKKAFYHTQTYSDLFGEEKQTTKVPDAITTIVEFYQKRLKTIFPRVVENPCYLCNSKQSPMFVLTFAIGSPNPKAQNIALRIADSILKKWK